MKKDLLSKTKHKTKQNQKNIELKDVENSLLFISQNTRKHVLERIARMCEWAIN